MMSVIPIVTHLADGAKYVLAFAVALGVTLLLVPGVMRLAIACGMVDQPGGRRVHKKPTPRGGGLAVFLGMHAALAVFFLFFGFTANMRMGLEWWVAFLASSTLLVVIGLIDDRQGMSALIKLFAQAGAAALFFMLNGGGLDRAFGLDLPWPVALAATVLWCVIFINAFNLIDGLDGLCSGLALIGALGLAAALLLMRQSADAIVPLAVAGACLGFLRYNFHPARVFLGDTGSMFLGFALALVAIPSGKSTAIVAIGAPLLAAGVPFFDTMLAIWRRSIRKLLVRLTGEGVAQKIMGADKEHLHHRLLARGLGQRQVALVLYAVGSAIVGVALLSIALRAHAVSIYLIVFVFAVYVIVRHVAHAELWDTGLAMMRGFSMPARKSYTMLFYLFWDLLVMATALAVAFILVPIPEIERTIGTKENWILTLPFWIAPIFICLFFTHSYQRVWSKAGMKDFLALQLGLFMGWTMVLALAVLSTPYDLRLELTRAVIYGSLVYLGVTGGRTFGQFLRVAMLAISEGKQEPEDEERKATRVIVYGTNERCLLFLKERFLIDPELTTGVRILGIIDEDPEMRKSLVKGYPVIGVLEDLSSFLENSRIDQLILTETPPDPKVDRLLQLAAEHGFALKEWNYAIKDFVPHRAR